jgi:hypothetical protein
MPILGVPLPEVMQLLNENKIIKSFVQAKLILTAPIHIFMKKRFRNLNQLNPYVLLIIRVVSPM